MNFAVGRRIMNKTASDDEWGWIYIVIGGKK